MADIDQITASEQVTFSANTFEAEKFMGAMELVFKLPGEALQAKEFADGAHRARLTISQF